MEFKGCNLSSVWHHQEFTKKSQNNLKMHPIIVLSFSVENIMNPSPHLRRFFPFWPLDYCNDSSIGPGCFYCLSKQQVSGQRPEWRVMRDIRKKVLEKLWEQLFFQVEKKVENLSQGSFLRNKVLLQWKVKSQSSVWRVFIPYDGDRH